MSSPQEQIDALGTSQKEIPNNRPYDYPATLNTHVGGELDLNEANFLRDGPTISSAAPQSTVIKASDYSLPVSVMTQKHFYEWTKRAVDPSTEETAD